MADPTEKPPGTLPDYPQGVMLSAEGLKTFIQELADLYIAGGYEASAIGDEIYEVFNNSRTRSSGGFGTREEIIALLTMELGSEGEAVLEQFADFFMMASNIWQFADYAGTGEYNFQDFVEAQIDSYELGSLTDFPEAFTAFTGLASPTNTIESLEGEPFSPEGQPAQQGEGLPVAPPIPISQIPYIPGADGKLGDWNWLDLWGDTNPLVEDFFDFWVDKFNEVPSDGKNFGYEIETLQHDFFYDDTHGLYAQDWWMDQQQSLLDHMEFFYNYGGEGDIESVLNTTMGGDAWRPWTGIVGIADRPETNAYNSAILEFTEWAREAIRDAGGKDALLNGVIDDFELAGYAYLIMSNGGATFKLGKDREGFRPDEFKEKAKQLIEKQFLANWTDEDGNFIDKMSGTMSFGVGSIRSLMNEWRALGKRNFQDFSDNELRKWAVDVKSEKLTKEMVDAEITKRAFHRIEWPFTPEEREDYIAKGATLDDVLNGQYLSVKSLWEDASLLPDDPWLLANYSFTDENGNRRFRSSQELMTHARTNMDKFQYSNESKDFHNDFITGAARMFRSSY